MKNIIINNLMDIVNKNTSYDDIKLKEIKYGLESFYLTITKTIVIFSISYLLGTIKTLALFMVAYTILRLTGFGLHTKKSWQCWVGSAVVFLITPYLCQNVQIGLVYKAILAVICILIIFKYAPADTEKKPLVNAKRRKKYKIICTITSLIYFAILLLINNAYIENIILFSMILESLLILPISYKLFGLKYDNYKDYLKRSTYASV